LYHRTSVVSVPLAQSTPATAEEASAKNPAEAAIEPAPIDKSIPAAVESAHFASNPLVAHENPSPPPPAPAEPERPEPQAAPVPAKSSATTARASNPLHADNRLLELLGKDIDKAVEQPAAHRRLRFSPEVVSHPKVRHFIRQYAVLGRKSFEELLARSGKFMPMIATVLASEGLPKELGYLALLESEFVVHSTSRNGAVGLWQFVAGTARQYGLRIDEWMDERRDPVKSTRAAAAYLKDLHDHYGRWFLATAAYNAGPGNVDKALRQSRAKDFWSLKAKAALSEETRNFVPKFIAIALIASEPQTYGLAELPYEPPLDYEEVALTMPMTLKALAELADTDVATLKELNPALLRGMTPPMEANFRVNLPVGHKAVYLAKFKDRELEKGEEPVRVVTHEVRRGETLVSIARYYGSSVRALMEINGLTSSRLRIGQKLGILLRGIRGTLR
jgi:membrane-bound lytic murein transglycosylase D